MKKFLISLLLAFLLVPMATQAQTHYNVFVGSGIQTSPYVPTYTFYNYSFTQFIYHASEIGIDGDIDQIGFEVDNGSATRTLTIYMAELHKSSFSSGSDAVAASNFQQVFQGTVSFSSGWVTITLDSAFSYQDTADLVIAFVDGTGSYSSGYPYYKGTSMSGGNRSIYKYNDNNPYSIVTPPTDAYSGSFLPNIRLGINSFSTYCATPSNVAVSNITHDQATITWSENGGATSWEVIVSDSAITDFTSASGLMATDTTYTITGLGSNILYYVYVRALCDASTNSAWTNVANFRSACMGATTVPYSTGFEDLATGEIPNCWLSVAQGSSSASNFPAAYEYSSNARNSNVYFEFESATAETEIIALPVMDDINTLQMSFYASVMSNNFVFEVGVMEDTVFVPVDTVDLILGSGNNWGNSYHLYTILFNEYSGTGDRMAMRTTGTSGQYTLMLDDLTVEAMPSCLAPQRLRVDSTGTNWAALGWREVGSATSWEVAYETTNFNPDTSNNVISVYDTSVVLTDLLGGHIYNAYVRSICSESSPWTGPLTFIPGQYVMGTSGSDTLRGCGYVIYDNGGPDAIYSTYSDYTVVIYPGSEDSVITFWGSTDLYAYYAQLRIYEGVGTNGTLLWQSSTNNYTDVIPHLRSNEGPITVRFTGGSYQSGYDGFELFTLCAPGAECAFITNLTASSVGTSSAALSWNISGTNFGVPTEYEILCIDTATDASLTFTSTTPGFLLTGLTANTTYKALVRSACDGGSNGEYDSVLFTTAHLPCLAFDTTISDLVTLTGSNISTSWQLPNNNYYNYGYTQQLVLAEEMTGQTIISGIDFDYAYTSPNSAASNCSIYLANVTVSDLSDGYVPYDSSNFVMVYAGPLVCTTTGWNHFEFTNSFLYTGDNLLVVVLDNSGSYDGSSYTFNVHYAEGKSRIIYNDGSPYDITNPTLGNMDNIRCNMRFHIAGCAEELACARPTVMFDSSSYNMISLSWTPGYQETSWMVEYKGETDTAWTSEGVTTNDFYIFTPLATNTRYTFRITSLCGDTAIAALFSAKTTCVPDSIPFFNNIESFPSSGTPACWFSGTSYSYGSYPYPVTYYAHSGVNSLYMYSDNSSYTYAALPVFNAPVDTLELTFWMYKENNSYSHELMVGVMTDPDDFSTFTSVATVAPTATNAWEAMSVRFNQYTGPGRYITIVSPVGSYCYPYIDDIRVDYIRPCARIENVSLSYITSDSALLHWSALGVTDYQYVFGPEGVSPDTLVPQDLHADSILLTSLTPNTGYDFYVRALCPSGDTSGWSNAFTFRTECLLLDTMYFTESFENVPFGWGSNGSTKFYPCWTRQNDPYDSYYYPYVYNYDAHHGANCIYWSWYSYDNFDPIITLPAIDTTAVPIDSIQVRFWGFNNGSSYSDPVTLYVGLMTDPSVPATFQAVDTVLVAMTEWRLYEIPLNGHNLPGNYIAIKAGQSAPNGSWYGMLDEIGYEPIPSCPHVGDLVSTGNTPTSVSLAWTERGEATQWQIAVDTNVNATPVADTTVIDTTFAVIGGLTSGQDYFFWVRAVCGAGDTSAWEGPIRVAPNSYVMVANSTDTVRLCGGVIYDDGGPDGNYSANQNSTVIIMPTDPTSLVSVSGLSYTEGTFDYITIYDGVGTSGTQLWTDYGISSTTTFGPFTSSIGPITVTFHTDGSVMYSGFEIHVDCIPLYCRPLNIRLNPDVPEFSTQLNVVWDNTDAISYEVEYDTVGFTRGTGTTITTLTPNAVLTGLSPLGRYDVYVRCICGVGDTGVWVMNTFQTAFCDGMSYVENIEPTATSTTSYYLPVGYSTYNYSYVQTIIDSAQMAGLLGEITAFAFHPYSTATGSTYFTGMDVYLANVSESDLSAGFILPDSNHQFVQVISNGTFNFTDTEWQLHSFDTSFTWDGHSNVLFAVNRNHGSWASSPYFCAHNTSSPKGRYAYNDNNPYNINTVSGGYTLTATGDIRLFTCNPITCMQPTITGITNDYQSATVNWTGTGTSYEVNIKEANATDWPATDIPVVGNSYTFTGLMPSTNYTIRVRQDCNADSNGFSEWSYSGFTTDSLPCLTPDNVTVSAITNASAVFDWTVNGNESMWDVHVWFTGGLDSIYRVTTHPATLSGFSAGLTYNVAVRPVCGAIMLEGDWSDTTTFTTATCPDVTGFTASNVTANSVTLNWNPDPAAQGWTIEYGYAGFIQGQGYTVTANTNTYVVNGLEDETDYDFHIKAICGTDWNSEHWVNVSATTLSGGVTCNAPTGVTVNATATTATVSWTPGEGNTSFELEYGATGFSHGSGSVLTVQNTSADINGLTPNTQYDVYVRGLCDQSTYSSWSTVTTFTTANVGIDNISGAVCTIYPNPTSSSTTITVSGVNGKVRISVVDMNGRTVATETLECNSDCTKTMDVDHLAQGAYFVRITGDEVNMVRKLVVR